MLKKNTILYLFSQHDLVKNDLGAQNWKSFKETLTSFGNVDDFGTSFLVFKLKNLLQHQIRNV